MLGADNSTPFDRGLGTPGASCWSPSGTRACLVSAWFSVWAAFGVSSMFLRCSFDLRSIFVRSSFDLRSIFVRSSFDLRSDCPRSFFGTFSFRNYLPPANAPSGAEGLYGPFSGGWRRPANLLQALRAALQWAMLSSLDARQEFLTRVSDKSFRQQFRTRVYDESSHLSATPLRCTSADGSVRAPSPYARTSCSAASAIFGPVRP